MLEKGLVQIYTGDGKGKTTAAIGLAVRAAGQGHHVLLYQFLKPPTLPLGERIIEKAANVDLKALQHPWDLRQSLHDESAIAKVRQAIAETLKDLTAAASRRDYDVMILDEIVFCYAHNLAAIEDIATLIRGRDPRVEIVLTGRGADAPLIDMADLVTEMKQIKHPFREGVSARKGIEY